MNTEAPTKGCTTMKFSNVKFSAIAEYSNGAMSDCRWFASEKAMSNWVNEQFDKDETVSITVWVGLTDRVYCTYHA